MQARTNTLGSGVADGETNITRRAFSSPIRGATRSSLRHTILARAIIACETNWRVSVVSVPLQVLAHTTQATYECTGS